MKKGFLLFTLLLIVPVVSAAIFSDVVFDKQITSSGIYEGSNGENFSIEVFGDSISIEFADGERIVENGSCESTNTYEVCLDINEFSHYNHTLLEKEVYFRDIIISSFVAELNLTRVIEKTGFWIGESTEVMLRIQNIGERPTTINFLDNYSDAFTVALPLKCNVQGNAVIWKGRLEQNEVQTCNYRITASSPGDFNSKAISTFNNGLEEQTKTDSINLEVKEYPLQVKIELTPKNVTLGESLNATFTLSATENINLQHYRISTNDDFIITSAKGIPLLDDKTAEYRTDIKKDDKLTFTLTLQTQRSGSPSLTEEALFDIAVDEKRVRQLIDRDTSINVTVKNITFRLQKNTLEATEDTLTFFVTNPSSENFYDVEVKLHSDIPIQNPAVEFDIVSLKGHRDFSKKITSLPGNHTLTAAISYRSQYGEIFSTLSSLNFTILSTEVKNTVTEETNATIQPIEEEKSKFNLPEANLSVKAVIFATIIVMLLAALTIFIARKNKEKSW